MIIPGLVSATFKTESPDFVLAALKKADLHAVEWSENWHIPAGDTALARDLRERTLAQGAEIAAYGSYYRLGQNSNPAKDFMPTLQSAAALGAPLIRIWGGGTASAELDADTRRELAVEARIVSDMAASEGIKVALEWHKNTVTDTNESGLSFLGEAAADNLYCLWQPTVALNMDERCAGLDMLEAVCSTCMSTTGWKASAARLRKVLTNGGGTYSMSTATKNATVCWNLCWTTPRSSFWKTPLNGSGFCRKRR
mgnify:CR=1 FL=1